jgi:hypothetical protein
VKIYIINHNDVKLFNFLLPNHFSLNAAWQTALPKKQRDMCPVLEYPVFLI